jgi:hypothetical protein
MKSTLKTLLFTALVTPAYFFAQQVNEAPQIGFDKSDVKCFGETTGYIESFIEGGHPPYTLSWSTGEEGNSIYNLAPGFYTLTVVDAAGSMNSRVTEITEPAALEILAATTNPTSTISSDGEILVDIVGGSPFKWSDNDYLFEWSNNSSELDLTDIGVGSYTLTVEDRNGCVTNESFILTAPLPMVDSWVELQPFHAEVSQGVVFPNPSLAGEAVSIHYNPLTMDNIQVVSHDGRVVSSVVLDNSGEMTLNQLEKGTYAVQFFQNNNKVESYQIIVR